MTNDRRASQNGSGFFSSGQQEGTPSGALAHVFSFIFFSLKALIRNSDQMPDFLFLLCLQFNFVGKLLGPRGNSMKRLQEETGVKMSILGKGSMRDKDKVGKIGFVF